MGALYNNEHSITFIRIVNGTTATSYKRSWYDFGLIPVSRPSVATPTPRVKLITIPGSNSRLDLTDITPGGLTFERRKGVWEFYVDTSKWNSWSEAKNAIESYLNGQFCYVILEDNHDRYYTGRVFITGWSNDEGYPTVEISYDFFYPINNNSFTYNLVPILLRISSSIPPGRNRFNLGDPINKARSRIITVATYDNGKTEFVDIDQLPGTFNILGEMSVTTRYRNKTSEVTCNVVEGEHDGNPDWILTLFRAHCRSLGLYHWDPFGLQDNSTLNSTTDAIEAELDQHVIMDPDLSTEGLLYPAIVFKLSSETTDNYIYRVLLCDYSTTSEFVTSYIDRFNMTIENTRRRGELYIITCTMTAEKLNN